VAIPFSSLAPGDFGMLSPTQAAPARGRTATWRGPRAPLSTPRQAAGRAARAPSSGAGFTTLFVLATRSARRRRPAVVAAALASSLATPPPPPPPPARDLLDRIAELPWPRMAVWVGVAWAAYQLRDFFGVRFYAFCLAPALGSGPALAFFCARELHCEVERRPLRVPGRWEEPRLPTRTAERRARARAAAPLPQPSPSPQNQPQSCCLLPLFSPHLPSLPPPPP